MRKPIYLFLACLFLLACTSSKNTASRNKVKGAVATQRLGEIRYDEGNYTAALKNLLEAYKIIPNDPYLNNSLGLVYLAKEKNSLAENHFKQALNLKADYIQAKNNLGAVYLKQKKWDLAIQYFKEVYENLLYATPEIPLSNLGWVYFHQKMYQKAEKYFEKSLEVNPGFLNAVHGLASIYTETENYTLAIDYLHHALKKNPGAAILHSDMAKIYEILKEFNKARRSWNAVLKLAPETSSLAREAQKRLLKLN